MSDKCPKCGKRLMLMTGWGVNFEPDPEPFEEGVKEEAEDWCPGPGTVSLAAHVCENPTCPHVAWVCCDSHEDVRAQITERDAEIKRLREELAEWLDMAMRAEGQKIQSGYPAAGWWYTMERRQLCVIGDRLVELGKWERRPDGEGTRQWYRPLHPAPSTDTEKP